MTEMEKKNQGKETHDRYVSVDLWSHIKSAIDLLSRKPQGIQDIDKIDFLHDDIQIVNVIVSQLEHNVYDALSQLQNASKDLEKLS